MVIRPDFHHFVKGDALVTIGGAVGVEATLSEESCRSQLMAGPGATPAPWGGSQCWRRRSRRCSIPSPLRASTPASRASYCAQSARPCLPSRHRPCSLSSASFSPCCTIQCPTPGSGSHAGRSRSPAAALRQRRAGGGRASPHSATAARRPRCVGARPRHDLPALHIANHLMFPAGEGMYDAVMKVFRHVYRNDVLQPLVV